MSSVDGLVSGMNTSDLIRQLMSMERQPVVRLQAKKASADKAITALQGLNTKFLAIADVAKRLSAAGGWSPVKSAVSHPDAVGVTLASGAAPASLSFKVASLAAAHQTYSAATYAAPSTSVADVGAPITIGYTDANGAAATLSLSDHDGTLAGIANAVNGLADSPVTARLVKTSDAGDYRLELTAKKTGVASAFTISGIAKAPGPDMAFTTATQASDAEILMGSSGTPLSITSSTNTITEVTPGVTLTLRKADLNTAVTVDVTRDTATLSADVEKMVALTNEFLKEAKTLTGYDAATKKGGLLAGNRTIRDLQSSVLQAVSDAVGGRSPIAAGLELTRDGLVKFDKAKFESAYAANPAAVAAIFYGPAGSEGVAQRLEAATVAATKSGTGLLSAAIDSRRTEIKRIDDTIATWDIRLVRKEAMLRKQFTALETALGAAQQQGNWLSGQIASLPKSS